MGVTPLSVSQGWGPQVLLLLEYLSWVAGEVLACAVEDWVGFHLCLVEGNRLGVDCDIPSILERWPGT